LHLGENRGVEVVDVGDEMKDGVSAIRKRAEFLKETVDDVCKDVEVGLDWG
jgi:hypothetical protein